MTEKAFVLSSDGEKFTVMPMKKDDCATCGSDCAKKSIFFTVTNPRSLPVKAGSIVKIQAPKKLQVAQGLISLLMPVLLAVLGLFLAKPILGIFGLNAGDGAKALFVLIFFSLSAALVYFVSRKFPSIGTPEIAEVFN